ncbi:MULTISPECIES: aspartoacylase [unclassified Coleofasciculus]|uniref:aspartoacylase n=1 Tax=unclassified Coleofasciculus TaxID=2692782 RepID=UPI0018809723|nr:MULTISPECIES: aspartoacylase [unclassified Coleofasciculus]MBE9125324.1 aspartoacylase [Coleofasciculus sp. LEGE 07081]MBE9148527.1 aspartoacylase [Coleofasciculus sp. LEGE 07092]
MINKTINRVAIVGGTHGNELTGVYLVKKFKQSPHLIQRSTFETVTLLANPKAVKVGNRYIDMDLNRCFKPQDLQNPMLGSVEQRRAKEIAKQIQEWKVDVLIDIHSSTANMGLTLILFNEHPFLWRLAAYLSAINPAVKILQNKQSAQDSPYLRSLCELGFTLEVGSISQGVLNAELFQQTEDIITLILDYIEQSNQGKILPIPSTITVYQYSGSIDYPRNDDGEIQAMIHPQLQFKDYEALNPGEPIFLSFDGSVHSYQGESVTYPVFINEAAYYEKGIAMYLTTKETVILDL